MGMGCGMSLIKYILFVFNLICALCGIALVSVGLAFLLKYDEIIRSFDEINVNVAPYGFIVLGSLVFIIAFFGCCGAIRESHCMVSTYASFLFFILVIQVIIGVLVFVNVSDIQRVTDRILKRLWKDRFDHRVFWDTLQTSLHCCGLNASVDWVPSTPNSCCEPNVIECVALVNAYQTGCGTALDQFVRTYGNIFGSVALGVAGVQFLGFIFACCLANNIRNRDRRYA